jgi:hypothetical protein
MFAAHTVAAVSAAERNQVFGETNDGDKVLFSCRIFLLTSSGCDAGQWAPATLVVTPKALRLSDTIDGCLSLPRYEFPLRHFRYAGVEFQDMQRRFGQVSVAVAVRVLVYVFVLSCGCAYYERASR